MGRLAGHALRGEGTRRRPQHGLPDFPQTWLGALREGRRPALRLDAPNIADMRDAALVETLGQGPRRCAREAPAPHRRDPCRAARDRRRLRASTTRAAALSTPPTPIRTRSGPASLRTRAIIAVERSKSGRPESPPFSCVWRRDFGVAGATTWCWRRSGRRRRKASATAITSSSSLSLEVRRDLHQERRPPARLLRRRGARLARPHEKLDKLAAGLQLAEPRRVRRRDVDGEVGRRSVRTAARPRHSRRSGPRCRGSRRC